MSKISDALLEYALKKKFAVLHEELKIDRKTKIEDIFLKLDELIKQLTLSNEDVALKNKELIKTNADLSKKLEDATDKYNILLKDAKAISEQNKVLTTKNTVLTEQLEIFQKTLVGAATNPSVKTELAYEGLKSKYQSLHEEKKDMNKTIETIAGVVSNVEKQNSILKSKLNLKGKIIDTTNEAQKDSKQEKENNNDNVVAK